MNNETNHLFLVMKTVLEMLFDRGYSVRWLMDDGTDNRRARSDKITSEKFDADYGTDRSKMTLVFTNNATRGQKCIVMFEEAVVDTPGLKKIVARVGNEAITRIILVCAREPSAPAKKVMRNMGDFVVEWFTEDELLCNVTNMRKSFAVKQKSSPATPAIAEDDPFSRYYGVRAGEGNHIVFPRPSETGGIYRNTRRVVYLEEVPKQPPTKKKKE